MAKGVINLQKESGGVTKITSTDGIGNTELVLPESGNIVSIEGSVTDNTIARFDGTTGKLQDSGVIIDDNGNVGIGESNPQYKLSLSQAIILPSTAGSKITAFSKYTNVGNASFLRFDTVRTSAGSSHPSSEERIQKVVDVTEMGYIGFGDDNVKLGNSSGDKVILDWTGNLLLTSGTGALGYGAGAGGTVTQLTSKGTEVTLNKPSGRIIMSNAPLAAGATVDFRLYNNLMGFSDTLTLSMPNLIANDVINYKVRCNLYNGGAIIFVTNISGSTLSEAISINFNLHKGVLA